MRDRDENSREWSELGIINLMDGDMQGREVRLNMRNGSVVVVVVVVVLGPSC